MRCPEYYVKLQVYTSALAAALQGGGGSEAACELAMEVCTRLVETRLPEATQVLEQAGWGPCCDAPAMLAHLERMAEALGMGSQLLSPGDPGPLQTAL